ncbi:hypothetical protein QBC37DRAFT_72611 [Rhypophila decipiens]|uniref:Uncharacterized protein n=1 Tax=Rhypophila decipiens TaxID=261697 RepID=A0AAN6YK14_9PEZI|nr:hypothetical protein QBC37DRAFT_72611 [Rhypophila decipiens]
MPFSRKSSVDSTSTADRELQNTQEIQNLQETQWRARAEIFGLIDERWESNRASIRLTGEPTYEELKNIGRLPRSQGILEFRKLIRAPVIGEEIATALWERMATKVRRESEDSHVDLDDPETEIAFQKQFERERLIQEINATRRPSKTSRKLSLKRHDPVHASVMGHDASVTPEIPDSASPAHPGVKWEPTTTDVPVCPALLVSPTSPALPPPPAISTDTTTQPEATKPEDEAPRRKLSWILPLAGPERRRSSTKTNGSDEPSTSEAGTTHSRRGSSGTTRSRTKTTSAKSSLDSNSIPWEEGFWTKAQDKQASQPAESNPNPLQKTTESPVSPMSTVRKKSFSKRIFLKLTETSLVGNIGEFGQSLGAGYGLREGSPVV